MGCIFSFNLGPLLPAFAFGFAVMIPVQIFSHISSCHMNPAVSIAFLIFGDMEWKRCLIYIAAQYVGSLLGFGLLTVVTPKTEKMCLLRLKVGITPTQGFFLEFLCTVVLIIFVFGAIDSKNATYRDSFCLRLGLMISGLVFSVESFTGAGLNPARSFPPALFENIWKDHWIYEIAPILGMATGAILYRFVLKEDEKYSLNNWLAKR
nr:aquaporin-like isoform X2 [Leptinotarsa decemlineata]